MRLVIVRHGEASYGADSDAKRQLTELGKKEALSTALQLRSWVSPSTKIVHSPFVRAVETADIIAHSLDLPMEVNDVLRAGNDYRAILSWLEETHLTDLIIVSHNPMVTEVTNCLVHGPNAIHQPSLFYDTGYAYCIEGEYPAAGCLELVTRIVPN